MRTFLVQYQVKILKETSGSEDVDGNEVVFSFLQDTFSDYLLVEAYTEEQAEEATGKYINDLNDSLEKDQKIEIICEVKPTLKI